MGSAYTVGGAKLCHLFTDFIQLLLSFEDFANFIQALGSLSIKAEQDERHKLLRESIRNINIFPTLLSVNNILFEISREYKSTLDDRFETKTVV